MVATNSSQSEGFFDWRETSIPLKVAHVLVAFLGVAGNVLVCFVIIRVKKLHTLTNYFILHQSVVDLLATLVFIFTFLTPAFPLTPNTVNSSLYCRLVWSEYILWALLLLSSMNLSALSMERYFGVCHPVTHLNKFNMKKMKIIIVFSWCVSFAYLSYWIALCTEQDGVCVVALESELFSRVGTFLDAMLMTLIPLAIMSFAYIKILRTLKTRVSPEEQTIGDDSRRHGNSKSWDKAKRNVIRTLCIVFITFTICWAPITIYDLLYVFGVSMSYEDDFYLVSVLFALCNMCVNPFIYALQYEQFKRAGKQLICRKAGDGPQENSWAAGQTNK